MKRIALIRNSYSFDVGGGEMFPINLAKIIAAEGYEPFILSSNSKTLGIAKTAHLKTTRSPWWSFQNFSGLGVLFFPAFIVWLILVVGWYCFYFLKNKIDIVNPQSRDDFIAATIAGKLMGKRVLWNDHADLKYIFANHKKWYKNPVGKLVYITSKLADHVVLESNSEKKLIEEALGMPLPKNYSVIYIGVVDSFQPIKREKGKLILVSTSRLVAAKGIGDLIEAMKLVDNTKVELKICGDGPEADYFKTMTKGQKNIQFLGHEENIVRQLQQSDILIHPSHHEGFGLSLVEAEMCGLPVIACSVGSVPEVVKNGICGLLVPPKDPRELAGAINTLVNNPKLRDKMGKAGRQFFLNNFQLDKIVKEQIIPLYTGK